MATQRGSGAVPTVIRADEGEAVWSVGALMVFKADAESTEGTYSVIEHTAAPGFETPYHVHHGEDELFYVIEGEIECYSGDDGEHVVRAGPDDTVLLPRELPHGFRVVSDDDCRMLIQLTPAGLEGFFADVGVPAERRETPPQGEPDAAALSEAAAKYGLEILGPLPE